MAPQALKITRPSSPAPQLPSSHRRVQFTTIRLTLHCSIHAEKRSGNGDGRKNKDRPGPAGRRLPARVLDLRSQRRVQRHLPHPLPVVSDRAGCRGDRQKRGQGMTGIMAIIVALVLLMVLAYRGLSLLILAPLLAALVAIVSVDTPLLASYTQVFMGAAGNFIVSFFPLFLLGAIFGKLMEDSGSAEVTLPPAERDLPPLPLALLPQAPRGAHHHPGQRRQRLAVADLQHRQPGRLRFGDRLARGLRGDQPLGGRKT